MQCIKIEYPLDLPEGYEVWIGEIDEIECLSYRVDEEVNLIIGPMGFALHRAGYLSDERRSVTCWLMRLVGER